MRRMLLAAAFIGLASTAHAQIPVTDGANLLAQAQNLAQEVKSYAVYLQQLQTTAQQLGWAVNTFNSLVANPSLGSAMGLLNAVGINPPLPVSPYAVQSLLSGQGGISGTLGALSSLANSSFSQNHVYAYDDGSLASANMAANAHSIAGAQGIAQQIYGQFTQRFPILASLRQDMLGATTPAEREHVMGQIQAEHAWSQHAMGQLQTVNLMLMAQKENRAQQDHERLVKSADSEIAEARAKGFYP